MHGHYEARASEYDDVWLGRGLYANRQRPGWDHEVAELTRVLGMLSPARTLDVACGTGFLTQHLPGDVVGLDQSDAMLEIARHRLPHLTFVLGDALSLPFEDHAFDRVFTSFFYGHLEEHERLRFMDEAWRVAHELVVVDSVLSPGLPAARIEERLLQDESRWRVFKRYFNGDALAEELGDGSVLFEGSWFVVARAPASSRAWTMPDPRDAS